MIVAFMVFATLAVAMGKPLNDELCLLQFEQKLVAHDDAVHFAGDDQAKHAQDSDVVKAAGMMDGLGNCITAYADGLDNVRPGLGCQIRARSLTAVSTSPRKMVFGAGHGSSGSSSLAKALVELGLITAHSNELAPSGYGAWAWTLKNLSDRDMPLDTCDEDFNNFNYTSLPKEIDAVVDTPVDKIFLDLFLSFPNAKWLLHKRPYNDWAGSRKGSWPSKAAPIEHPCGGIQVDMFNQDDLGRLASLHDDLVRCVVPRERLFEFDIFMNGTSGLMHQLGLFLERPDPPPASVTYPHIGNYQLFWIDPDTGGTSSEAEFVARYFAEMQAYPSVSEIARGP
mmetsp:Transcript_17705/g.37631  ORF Transcript_17705/g.37631 Transcript_17705/m.37631 type:complete len:339 (+) Transcript_17705:93-1109(+)